MPGWGVHIASTGVFPGESRLSPIRHIMLTYSTPRSDGSLGLHAGFPTEASTSTPQAPGLPAPLLSRDAPALPDPPRDAWSRRWRRCGQSRPPLISRPAQGKLASALPNQACVCVRHHLANRPDDSTHSDLLLRGTCSRGWPRLSGPVRTARSGPSADGTATLADGARTGRARAAVGLGGSSVASRRGSIDKPRQRMAAVGPPAGGCLLRGGSLTRSG